MHLELLQFSEALGRETLAVAAVVPLSLPHDTSKIDRDEIINNRSVALKLPIGNLLIVIS